MLNRFHSKLNFWTCKLRHRVQTAEGTFQLRCCRISVAYLHLSEETVGWIFYIFRSDVCEISLLNHKQRFNKIFNNLRTFAVIIMDETLAKILTHLNRKKPFLHQVLQFHGVTTSVWFGFGGYLCQKVRWRLNFEFFSTHNQTTFCKREI